MRKVTRGCFGLLVAGIALLQAEYEPSFDLDTCVAGSQLIVTGQLSRDGQLRIDQVLEGKVDHSRTIHLSEVGLKYRLGSQFDKRDVIDVVAFLTKDGMAQWALVLGWEGLVIIEGNRACPYGVPSLAPTETPELRGFIESSTFDRDGFIAAIHRATTVAAEIDRLLEQPRSLERNRVLIRLTAKCDQLCRPPFAVDPFRPSYLLGKIAEALRDPSDEEELELIDALQRAQNPQEQRKLLEVARLIPVRDRSFDAIADFVSPDHAPEVRRAAMQAIQRINGFRAVNVLVPLLTRKEPELETALQSLGPVSMLPSDKILNLKAVEALEKLAGEIELEYKRRGQAVKSDNTFGNQCGAFVMQLQHFAHLRLIPILIAWALGPDHPSWGQAWSNLCAITGLNIPRENPGAWQQWWDRAKPLLAAQYKLKTQEGRNLWMEAWTASDSASRRILLNLWWFEPDVDEPALLTAAKTSGAARAALSELWRLGRLSSDAKRSIVERLLVLRVKGGERINGRRQFYIAAETEFNFPQNAQVEYRLGDLSGKHPGTQVDQEPWGARGLNGDLSRIGGVEEDSPDSGMVHSALDIREVSFRPERKVLWSVRKGIGPIKVDASHR
jgi:hypothetical protein